MTTENPLTENVTAQSQNLIMDENGHTVSPPSLLLLKGKKNKGTYIGYQDKFLHEITLQKKTKKTLIYIYVHNFFLQDINRSNISCRVWSYSVSTKFRHELIEPSAREVFIFWTLVEREGRVGDWGEEKKTFLKPSETRNSVRAKKLFIRRLNKLMAKFSGHAVW